MPRLAIYTLAFFKDTVDTELRREFLATAQLVFAEAKTTAGFIDHAGNARPDLFGKSRIGEDFGPWGVGAVPHFWDGPTGRDQDAMVVTLSLWTDIEAVRNFSYAGRHRAALKRRKDWLRKSRWPGYVLWWVADRDVPTWADGACKLEALDAAGPSPTSFNFASSFDSEGVPG